MKTYMNHLKSVNLYKIMQIFHATFARVEFLPRKLFDFRDTLAQASQFSLDKKRKIFQGYGKQSKIFLDFLLSNPTCSKTFLSKKIKTFCFHFFRLQCKCKLAHHYVRAITIC